MTATSHRDAAVVMECVDDVTLSAWKYSMGERRTVSLEINGADGLVDSCVNEKDLSRKYEKNKIAAGWMVDQLKALAQCHVYFFISETLIIIDFLRGSLYGASGRGYPS